VSEVKNEVQIAQIESTDIEAALSKISETKGITRNQILGENAAKLTAPEMIQRIAEIKSKLDGNVSTNEITNFGHEIGQMSDQHTSKLLNQVGNADLEELGSGLTKLVLATREHAQNAISYRDKHQKSKIPLIGKYIDQYREKKETNKIMYETTKESIDRMLNDLNIRQSSIQDRNKSLDEMYDGVIATAHEIGLYIIGAQIRVDELKAELAALSSRNLDNSDKFLVQEIYDLNSAVNSLEKRIDDMYLLQQASFLTLPQIRLIQQNNRDLSDKFNTIKSITIPTWKNSYAMAISLKEQQNNVELINSIDEHTNALMKNLADQLHTNSVQTARANTRNAISVDTIEHIQAKLAETVGEVLTIQKKGIEENRAAILRLSKNKTFASELLNQNVDQGKQVKTVTEVNK
jgi:uncharacterized protein YaaN involved in tellurite resistance